MPLKVRSKRLKVLFVDIETAPKLSFHWNMWKENISTGQMVRDTYVLCWCAKWAGDDYLYYDALHYHKKEYKKDPHNDAAILPGIHDLLSEADIVVAHNGARFDVPVLNARFITAGMPPPSAFKVVDTLQIARRLFNFTSNRLDDLGKQLKVGRKIDTGGFELWKTIVQDQNLKSFDKMVTYNCQDVQLLEKVYDKLKGWDMKHPGTVIISDPDNLQCNVCGSSDLFRNGSYCTNTQIYQKYKCKDCGHNMRDRKSSSKMNTLASV